MGASEGQHARARVGVSLCRLDEGEGEFSFKF